MGHWLFLKSTRDTALPNPLSGPQPGGGVERVAGSSWRAVSEMLSLMFVMVYRGVRMYLSYSTVTSGTPRLSEIRE